MPSASAIWAIIRFQSTVFRLNIREAFLASRAIGCQLRTCLLGVTTRQQAKMQMCTHLPCLQGMNGFIALFTVEYTFISFDVIVKLQQLQECIRKSLT
jgi:hypothetical protein